jgi:hypothetical protein
MESTVTVVVAVVVPLPLTAVRVYRVVVERAGVVVLVPVTVPIPGLMEVELALETLKLRVEVPFRATTLGEAEKEEMAGGLLAVTVVDAVEVLFEVSVERAQRVVEPLGALAVFQGTE